MKRKKIVAVVFAMSLSLSIQTSYLPPQSPLKVVPSIRLRMASPVIGLSEDMRLPSLEIPTYVQMGLYSNWESGHHILDAYSNSESWNADETALYPVDYIYVKCRLYEDNALYRRAEDEQKNAAVARGPCQWKRLITGKTGSLWKL